MAVTLLRHAAVSKELQGSYLGWNDVGIDEELFEESKVSTLKETHFDLIISSDLIRCKQTLEKLRKIFTTDSRLREVKFKAEIEGKRFSDIEKLQSYRPEYLEFEDTWHTYICEEPQALFRKRIEDFLTTLPRDKEILLCSHAGSIKVMMELLRKEVKTLKYLEHTTYEL